MPSNAVPPDHKARPGNSSRGTNQIRVRLYNERLVLSLIRRHQRLAKADIARMTGLSPQTISIITNQLTTDGLLKKGRPQRGRVGQPSVPYSLNPEGAFSIGLKIGRRSGDLVLIDFVGNVRAKLHRPYEFPDPDFILDFLVQGAGELVAALRPGERRRFTGIGIASPFELWNWQSETGAPRNTLDRWRGFDIKAEAARKLDWPIYYHNDATAACAAELMLGNPEHHLDFLYMFIGTFIGGGVVLNGTLYPGRSSYAGAIGPMPVPVNGSSRSAPFQQLLQRASIVLLADMIAAGGGDPHLLWQNEDNWDQIGAPLEAWIVEVALHLAQTVVAATSVIDFEAIVIDGAFPSAVRDQIVARTIREITRFNLQGLIPAAILAGSIGPTAPAIGGACLPLLANFSQDPEVLFNRPVRSGR